jgi:oligopeptidase B
MKEMRETLKDTFAAVKSNPGLFVAGTSASIAAGWIFYRWTKYRVLLEPIFDETYGVKAQRIPRKVTAGKVEGENRGPNPADPAVVWEDPFFWMRDDKRADSRVIAHLNRENAYFDHKTKHLQGLKAQIYNEFVSHTKETDEEVPYPHGDWFYYTRTVTGKSYKIHCRKPSVAGAPGGAEQVLLDVNELARGRKYCDVQSVRISPDHTKLAFTVDFVGYETYDVLVKDLSSGRVSADVLHETAGEVVWGKDSSELYYTTMDDEHRPFKCACCTHASWLHIRHRHRMLRLHASA